MEPTEVFNNPNAYDSITRRMWTKDQYTQSSAKGVKMFTDAEYFKKLMFDPLLDALCDDEDMRRELEEELQDELMPQFHAMMEKSRIAMDKWLKEEVIRIYGE